MQTSNGTTTIIAHIAPSAVIRPLKVPDLLSNRRPRSINSVGRLTAADSISLQQWLEYQFARDSMQRYKILHRTYYNFSDNVRLGPHHLRLRPKEDYKLRVESFALNITPPARLLWHRDVEGNSVAIATFDSPSNQLPIESEVIIQQCNETPLDFLIDEYAVHYPFTYISSHDKVLLAPYMELPDAETRTLTKQWITEFWQPGERIQTYSLLQRLGSYMNHNLSYQIREEQGVHTEQQTLATNTGSCRDFAVLFM